MPSKNLWGDLGAADLVRTPTTVLKEQASALTIATKGVLHGRVSIDSTLGRQFRIGLSIIAPAINNYEFSVVFVQHGIELYPAIVTPGWDRFPAGYRRRCEGENALMVSLERILGSDKVKRVIQSLISQSKAM